VLGGQRMLPDEQYWAPDAKLVPEERVGQGDSKWDPTWGRGRSGHGRPPFGDTIITAWHFERSATDEALEALEWDVLRARRSGALVAPAGSGRTHLLRLLGEWINPVQWESVYVPNPIFDHEGLCRFALGLLDGNARPIADVSAELDRRLEQLWIEGRSLLLLIDDAEHMPEETLHACLEMAEKHSPTLVHLFAVAGESHAHLMPHEERDDFPIVRLAQPFSEEETRDYVLHRLDRSGATGELRDRFTDEAVAHLHGLADGSLVRLHTLAQIYVETPAESAVEAWQRFLLDERGIIGLVDEMPSEEGAPEPELEPESEPEPEQTSDDEPDEHDMPHPRDDPRRVAHRAARAAADDEKLAG